MASKREVQSLIYLTGSKREGFRLRTAGFDGCDDEYHTSSMQCGHAMVRALREIAYRRPDLFPASVRAIAFNTPPRA